MLHIDLERMEAICEGCAHDQKAPGGVCAVKPASDGLDIRCVGIWSKDKHYYLKNYVGIFTQGMRKIWPTMCYIDLFAGPGKCRVRDNEEEIDGSPLIALNARYPFSSFFFSDLNENVVNTLDQRIKNHPLYDKVDLLCGDANDQVAYVVEKVPTDALCLSFIDPTGLDFDFVALEKLATRRVDLLLTFPTHMALGRNLPKFLKTTHCKLDDVIGDSEWRRFKTEIDIIAYYKKKLSLLGYQAVQGGDEILIRNPDRNSPLYSVIFASKHERGYDLFKKICMIDSSGQRQLF